MIIITVTEEHIIIKALQAGQAVELSRYDREEFMLLTDNDKPGLNYAICRDKLCRGQVCRGYAHYIEWTEGAEI